MRDCSITREENDKLDVLRLDGSLDSFSFPKLEKALGELRDQDRHCVVLDCKGLDYISSVALGALIGFSRRAREHNGDLKLVNLTPKIFNIVELLGFDRILEIHDTEEKAVAKF